MSSPNNHRSQSPSFNSSQPPTPSSSASKVKKRRKRGKASKKHIKIIGTVSGDLVQIGFENQCTPESAKDKGKDKEEDKDIIPHDEIDNVIEVVGGDTPAAAQMPSLPVPNEHYRVAAKLFKVCDLSAGKIPYTPPDDLEAEFYFFYIANALRNLLNIGHKLVGHWWVPELREGWYDSSVWCHFIDTLCNKSEVLSLLRKEIGIIPRGHPERFDGVFRYMDGVSRFDLGLVEVGPLLQYPNSDPKPGIDREKILYGMSILLNDYRKHTQHPRLQVIGILCSGWSITISRMCYHAEGSKCRVIERKFAIRTDSRCLHKNMEVFEALVQAFDIMIESASILSARV